MTVAWPLLTLVAVIGWGMACAWLARRFAGVDLSRIGICLAVGLVMYLTVSGLAVAFDAFSTTLVTAFVGVGIACALAGAAMYAQRTGFTVPRRHLQVAAVGCALVGIVLAIALFRTANFNWNPGDDDVAYLYLVRRLTVVGNLLEPLNNRRLTSLGGATALQALYLGRLPDIFLPFADAFLGSLLILFALWRTSLARWSVWGIGAALVVILFPFNLGDSINTSPIYLPVGLTMVVFSVALTMRAEVTTARGHLVCSVVLGALAAGVVALRPQFGPPVVLLALVAAVWPARNSRVAARLAGLAAGSAAVLTPWAVASWRAVGTPLFPLLTGNGDAAWWPGGPSQARGPSLWDLAVRLGAVAGSHLGVGFLASAAIAGCLYFWRRGRGTPEATWAMRLWCVVAFGSVLVLIVLADQGYLFGPPMMFARYWAPAIMASILIPLVAINVHRAQPRGPARYWGAAVLAVVLVATGAPSVGSGQYLVKVASDTLTGRPLSQLSVDRYALERRDYAQVAALVPRGSKVLAAVDYPTLLLGTGLDVTTIDMIGTTSPSPRMPYFIGSAAKVAWLRANGYDYVIASDPATSFLLYNRAKWVWNLGTGHLFGDWAPFFLDWFNFIQDRSLGAPSHLAAMPQFIILKI
ncbi:MAG TPA: hypothetical protein VH498_08400 [Candidatus Dormibacteraeota bacterium]|nr:hypothetical protein [Candidatus Dormibacteraeota bacterium]